MIIETLTKDDIKSGALILVNAAHPVPIYQNKQFIRMDTKYPNMRLESKTASILSYILNDLACRSQIIPVSGYRSRKEQEQIYSDSLRENGITFTRKYVALPDHSEHQTGLAVDLGWNPNFDERSKKKQIDFIRPDFPYEGICDTFRQNAPRYGFIQRYQKDKEAITGISHEPWHFRYVGWPHSEIMQDKGMALEEYMDFLRQFPFRGTHLKVNSHKKKMEIYYIPIPADGETGVTFPDETVYELSGNNVDGCIITEWRNEE